MQDIGGMYTRIEADTSGLAKAEGDISSFAQKAAGLFAAAFAVDKIKGMIETVTMATARYDTLGVVMDTVGKNAGYTAAQMATFQTGLEKTGISMTSSREALTKMSQAQLDLTKSSQLARIAQDAAVIGNINSSEAFERMVNGIQEGSVLILRNIGLNVNFEASYQKLAATLHKTVDELTDNEKVTARMNAVLEKGSTIAGAYEAAMDTPMKQWLSMQRYVDNLEVSLGRVFQPAFGTAVKAMTEGLKSFTASLDDSKVKEWGDSLNNIVKWVTDANGSFQSILGPIAAMAEAFVIAKAAQIAFNIAASANPYILAGKIIVYSLLALNVALKEHGLQLKDVIATMGNFAQSYQGLAAVFKGDISFWAYATSGPKELKEALASVPTEIDKTKSEINQLNTDLLKFENYKPPTFLPSTDGIKEAADNIKNEYNGLIVDLAKQQKAALQNKGTAWALFPDAASMAASVAQTKATMKGLDETITGVKGSWKSATMEVLTAQVQQDQAVAAGTQGQARSLVELTKKYEEFKNNVKKINDEIRQNQMTGDEMMFSILQANRTAPFKWDAQKAQAEAYVQEAQKAYELAKQMSTATGKDDIEQRTTYYKQAEEYADLARRGFSALNGEVKDGAGVWVTQQQAMTAAIAGVKKVTDLKDEILKSDKEVNTAAANALVKEGGSAVGKMLDDIDTKSKDLVAQSFPAMGDAFNKVWKDGADSANIVFTNIDQSATATAKKINDTLWAVPKSDYVSGIVGNVENIGKAYIEASAKGTQSAKESADLQIQFVKPIAEKVQGLGVTWDDIWREAGIAAKNATDEMIRQLEAVQRAAASIRYSTSVDTSSDSGYQTGGWIQRLKEGGQAIMAAAGQYFPGYGGGDKIPILGEAGEFMIRKEANKDAGRGTTEAYNRGDWATVVSNLSKKLQLGGPTSFSPSLALAGGGQAEQFSQNNSTESVRKYFIQGIPEPITVRADKRNADRIMKELERRYRRSSS